MKLEQISKQENNALSKLTIVPVQTRTDLKDFIHLPFQCYRKDPNWVPPLLDELEKQFDPKRNPFLDHCEYALFLLRNRQQVIGRIAAFFDTLAIQAWKE